MPKDVKIALWVGGGLLGAMFSLVVLDGFFAGVFLTLSAGIAVVGALLVWVDEL